jgi:hypothetical protein
VSDSDGVERFKRLDDTKRSTIFLDDTEPWRSVRRVGRLEDSSIYLLPYESTDMVIDSWWYWNVSHCPRSVGDRRYLDRWEEIFAKVTSFCVAPRETVLVDKHKVVHKVAFCWPKEIAWVCLVDEVPSLESVSESRLKWRGIGTECRE